MVQFPSLKCCDVQTTYFREAAYMSQDGCGERNGGGGGSRGDKEMTPLIMKCSAGRNDGPQHQKDVWSIIKFGHVAA